MGRPVSAFVLLIGVVAITAAPAAARTSREPVRWAPAASAAIHPGDQTFTNGNQCTANFVFQEITPAETNVYIGQAAHCSGPAPDLNPNGCSTPSLPEGTPVDVDGSDGTTYHGTMAYNSWDRMQSAHETDPYTCQYNDLALIKLQPADVAKVNPSVPGWGGPTGVGSEGEIGSDTYSYGNSDLRQGVSTLSPRQGLVEYRQPAGWDTEVYMVSPALFGDSGSAMLNAAGEAAGVLSTFDGNPPGAMGIGDLPRELEWMHAHGGPRAEVVKGTEPFQTDLATAMGLPPG